MGSCDRILSQDKYASSLDMAWEATAMLTCSSGTFNCLMKDMAISQQSL